MQNVWITGRKTLVVIVLLMGTGCGSRGVVSGKVTYQGKSVPGGMVLFLHETKGAFSSPIKEDGTYQITNVPSGAVKVAVVPPSAPVADKWRGPAPSEADLAKAEEGQPKDQPKISREALKEKMGVRPTAPKGKAVHIPDKYGNPDQSGQTYTVIAGPQTHDITLD
jgi:hypothetical protein